MEMEPLYKPQGVEERWQRTWEESGDFHADPASDRPTYVIAVPPPNVTGALHMGHALNGTIQDALVRWHRMRGFNTLWQPGYDHAGIATQAVVEKELRKQGTSRYELGREAFVERVWEWLHEYGGVIMGQFRRLGASLDYERARFTMDEAYVRAVMRFFAHRQLVQRLPDVDLRPRGRPHRGRRRDDVRALPAGGRLRLGDDRDRAPRDDPRRRGGGGAPRRRALHRPDRQGRNRAGGRADGARDRRRAGRAGSRHRRAEGHARARPDRLRDRPRPRPARADGDRLRRPHDRRRPARARGPHRGRGVRARRRLAARARPAREARELPARGRALRALGHAHPATRVPAVVVRDGRAREAGARGDRVRSRDVPSARARTCRARLAEGDPPVEPLSPAVVGPPAADLVLPRRARDVRRDRSPGLRRVRLGRADSRPRRARHVVLVGAVAVRDARLARRHGRAARVLSGRRQLDRARDHLPLGEPDADGRARAARRDPVPRRDHPLDRARGGRPAHVEVARQRRRPHRPDRRARRGRHALRAAEDVVDPGRTLLHRADRGGAQAKRSRHGRRRSRSAGSSVGSTRRAPSSRPTSRRTTSRTLPPGSTT